MLIMPADPDQKYLCVCDLGIDRVMAYRFDRETGQLELDEERQSGCRMDAAPSYDIPFKGKDCLCSVRLSSQVFVLSYHPDRGFEIVQTVNALTEDNPIPLQQPSGSVRMKASCILPTGEDSISVFRVRIQACLSMCLQSEAAGAPRDFILSDSLLLCANRDTDNIVVFRLLMMKGPCFVDTHSGDNRCLQTCKCSGIPAVRKTLSCCFQALSY